MASAAAQTSDAAADVLTIFGISGDLAKKMTFRALYRLEAREKLTCRIVGVAIDDWDDETLRTHARDSIGATVGDALLAPHRSYLHAIRPLLTRGLVKGMAHITGGGITENLPRVLPRGVAAVIEMGSWQVPPIFEHLQQLGNVPQDEMLRTFNMGLGMLLVVPSKKFKKAQTVLERAGEKAFTVGRIVKGDRKVMYT